MSGSKRQRAIGGTGSVLSQNDLRSLHRCVQGIYAHVDSRTFAQRLIETIEQLVPADMSAFNDFDCRRSRINHALSTGHTFTAEEMAAFERFMHEHPLLRYVQSRRSHRAVRFADVISRQRFHRTGIYNEFFRRIGLEYQVAFAISTEPGRVIGISLNRRRTTFSDRDKLVLDLLQPHVLQAHRAASAFANAQRELGQMHLALEQMGRGIIALSGEGRIINESGAARRMLDEFYPNQLRGDRLPDELADWIASHSADSDSQDIASPRLPLVCDRPGRRLIARLMEGEQRLLILEEQSFQRQTAALGVLGLTERESQVLAWLSQGKTDSEIAILTGLSPRTVQKHMEHIFRKLGVSTRIEAVLRALEVCG